jgi:VWFA-related protein
MPRVVVVAGLVCLAGITLPARQPPQPPPPQFRTGVDLVHLDVSVLDRNRRPVKGLTPADFTVLEDGVPQELSVFTAVEIDDPEPPAAAWVRDVAPDVRSNEGIEERRLFLIIIDDAMIQADVGGLKNTRDIARSVVDRMGPSDLAAVLFTRDNRHSQDYTSDRARLRAAVQKFTVGFRDMNLHDDLYWIYSADVVNRAVETLTTLPDRRKAVIYIGQGVPVDLEVAGAAPGPGLPADGGRSAIAAEGVAGQIQQLMSRTFRNARLANVNVYTVDVCGLRVIKFPVRGAPPPTCLPGREVEYLQTIAANTGARAVVNTNDFEPGVRAIFDENASYYLLGYQPPNPAQDGRFRRLEVRVNRPGVEVRTRSGYQPEKPRDAERRRAALAKQPLGAALAGVLPKSDLPLDVTAAAVPVPGKRESAVAIVVGIRQTIRVSGERIERVDLQVSAYNTDGRHFGSSRYRADVTLRPGATGLAEYEVLARLNLRPGRYQLRIAGHVGSLSTSGSLYYDVDVPDVSRAAVSLTPLMLSASPGPVAAPRDALAGVLPIVPTSRRTFSGGHQVAAFTRVHQRGRGPVRPVTLRLRLEDQDGRVVMERPVELAAVRFNAARAADVNIALPVAKLDPGAYLLTVETAGGETPVRRVIRFDVE